MSAKIYTKTGDDGTTALGKYRISKTDPIIEVMGELDLLQSYLGLIDAHISEKGNLFDTIRNDVRMVQYHLYNLAGRIHRNYKPPDKRWSYESLLNVFTYRCIDIYSFPNISDAINNLFFTCWNFIFRIAPEDMTFFLPDHGDDEYFNFYSEKEKNYDKWLEERMDEMNRDLPPLTNFIRPGGDVLVASIHMCRSVCRKLEIKVHKVHEVHDSSGNPYLTSEDAKVLNRMSDWLFVLARHCHFTLSPEKEEHVFTQNKN